MLVCESNIVRVRTQVPRFSEETIVLCCLVSLSVSCVFACRAKSSMLIFFLSFLLQFT